MLISGGFGAFCMWIYYKTKNERKIEKFIKDSLKKEDLKIYEDYNLEDYKFDYAYLLGFLKLRLSERNFKEFLNMAKIKSKVKKVTSTEGLMWIDDEIFHIPDKIFEKEE